MTRRAWREHLERNRARALPRIPATIDLPSRRAAAVPRFATATATARAAVRSS
jgi:hypothetical protein